MSISTTVAVSQISYHSFLNYFQYGFLMFRRSLKLCTAPMQSTLKFSRQETCLLDSLHLDIEEAQLSEHEDG